MAVETLQKVLNLDANKATQLLWSTYHPWQLWIPFASIGLASASGIAIYARWVAKYEAADV